MSYHGFDGFEFYCIEIEWQTYEISGRSKKQVVKYGMMIIFLFFFIAYSLEELYWFLAVYYDKSFFG
jgi:hypothetical protein